MFVLPVVISAYTFVMCKIKRYLLTYLLTWCDIIGLHISHTPCNLSFDNLWGRPYSAGVPLWLAVLAPLPLTFATTDWRLRADAEITK